MKQVRLIIEPKIASLYQQIKIKVSHLLQGEEVIIKSRLTDEIGRLWKAEVKCKADDSGSIDLARDAPLSGSYDWVDPMGIFSTMLLESTEKNQTYFRWRSWNSMFISIQLKRLSGEIIEEKIERKIITRPLSKKLVNEKTIVGNLVCPEGEGPFPGVILVGGKWKEPVADAVIGQFAEKGYGVLNLAYHSLPGLPPEPCDIPIEYLHKAILWMKKNKTICSEHLALIGYSMGGVFALLGASLYPEIKVVVSLVGRGVVPQALELDTPRSVFTLGGSHLPFLFEDKRKNIGKNGRLKMILDALSNADEETIESVSIKVERIQGAVLMIAASDDRVIAGPLLSNIGYNRLVKNHFKYPYEQLIFKGSGHLTAAGLPYQPATAELDLYGGNPRDQAEANLNIWKKTIEFLDTHVKKLSNTR